MDAKIHRLLGSKYAIDILFYIRDNPRTTILGIVRNFHYGAHTTIRKRISEFSDFNIISVVVAGCDARRKEVILTEMGESVVREVEYNTLHHTKL